MDQLHQAGIGVIVMGARALPQAMSWALANFDGQPLYEHPDPRRGEHKDWQAHLRLRPACRRATSWWPTPTTGSRSSTWTGSAWTRWPPCCTWTTPEPR
ncbi:hypothetical protein QJS66_09430 [Kocuria rhizophila]|nr:hypothetical protein QJS66_09430 [Kocuria rhizophila]